MNAMTFREANERAVAILMVAHAKRETAGALRYMAEHGLDRTEEFRSGAWALGRQTAAFARHRAAKPSAN
jgi:hypothetical protein